MVPATSTRRSGFSVRGLLLVLAVVVGLLLVAWMLVSKADWSAEESGPLMYTVKQGDFVHEIAERGDIESASNVEIRCEVQSRGRTGTTILWIVPEGTYVQPGDRLVTLDSSMLEDELRQQQIVCNNSEAAEVQARNNLKTARIAMEEYLKGAFRLDENVIERKKFVAQEAKRQAEQTLEYSKGLAKKGYVTELRVETDRIAVDKAQLDYDSAELELNVLRQFTKNKMLLQLETAIKTAEARLKSEQASHEVDVNKRALIEEQIAKCTITAEEPGQVVYANETNWRGGNETIIEEGTVIREHQVIIRLPDPKRMQVKAKINEAKIALVKPGMPVSIEMDAFTDVKLAGVVEKVNEYPAPSSWWSSSIKEYETFIKILGSPTDLKPGLTAEVRIQVENIPGVLQVPVQAIIEHGGKHYCVLRDGTGWRAQEVEIGSTNDKFVVIRKGLNEGQQVVLAAFNYRDDVNLPKLKKTPEKRQTGGKPAEPDHPRPRGPKRDAKRPPADSTAKQGEVKDATESSFGQLDKNHDGKLEKDELPSQMQSSFSTIDADKNGSLNHGELTAAMSRPGSGAPGKAKPKGAGATP